MEPEAPARSDPRAPRVGASSLRAFAQPINKSPPLAVCLLFHGQYPRMKSPTELLEQIIRAETALHLKLVAQRSAGKADIGGRGINDLIQEVDQGLSSAERMLVFFKNEDAAEIMLAALESTN